VDPIITWIPWNPVAIKKVEPYTLSAILKDASKYSMPCKRVKYPPNNKVINNPWRVSVKLEFWIAWWDHVTVTPDLTNTPVFNSGTLNLSKGVTPTGGQTAPHSTFGAKLEWKKAQKNLKKKKHLGNNKQFYPVTEAQFNNFSVKPVFSSF